MKRCVGLKLFGGKTLVLLALFCYLVLEGVLAFPAGAASYVNGVWSIRVTPPPDPGTWYYFWAPQGTVLDTAFYEARWQSNYSGLFWSFSAKAYAYVNGNWVDLGGSQSNAWNYKSLPAGTTGVKFNVFYWRGYDGEGGPLEGTIGVLYHYVTADSSDVVAINSNLQTAVSAANSASANAQNAYNAANAAKSSADTAAARVWDSTEGKSAATLAKEARDKANQALTEINNVKTIVASIQSSVGPQILKVRGLNGATATRTNTFTVTVEAANATEFRVRVDGGGWSAWTPVSSPITLTGFDAYGAHTIYVEVRNASGATATGQMTAFRL